ncbi:MAG TPA: GTP cyclohydrolase II [Candidatus Binatia bacterium]
MSAHVIAGQMLSRGAVPLETVHGPFRAHVFQNVATGAYAFAVARGDLAGDEPLLARVHSSCVTSETWGGCDCDCVDQLDLALERIADAGRGVVFYLMQEGRGAGFTAKARDRMIVQASRNRLTTFDAYEQMGLGRDHRRYDEVAHVCRALGIRAPLRLLSNNPEKVDALRGLDVAVEDTVPLRKEASPYNLHYLTAKSRSGHALDDPGDDAHAAELPEAVVDFAPYALADEPRFVHLATYLLPVRLRDCDAIDARPHWFRVHAYFDLVGGREQVVLSYGPRDAATPLVRVQRESWLERFPLASGGAEKRTWQAAVRAMVAHGAGFAAFVPVAGFAPDLHERTADADAAVALLAHHVRGRAVHPLLAARDLEQERALMAALARRGVELREPVVLDDERGAAETAPATQPYRAPAA